MQDVLNWPGQWVAGHLGEPGLALPSSTQGAFSSVTSNTGSTFSAATSFCAGSTQTITADASTDVRSPATGVNYGGSQTMDVQSDAVDMRRVYVHFALPAVYPKPPRPFSGRSVRMQGRAAALVEGKSKTRPWEGAAWRGRGLTRVWGCPAQGRGRRGS